MVDKKFVVIYGDGAYWYWVDKDGNTCFDADPMDELQAKEAVEKFKATACSAVKELIESGYCTLSINPFGEGE